MKTKIQEKLKKISYWMSVLIIGIIFGVALQFAKAWTEPTATPPAQNVGAPINTGAISQTKIGDICTNSGGTTKCLSATSGGGLNCTRREKAEWASWVAVVYCNSGEVATGGGAGCSNNSSIYINSFPTIDGSGKPNGWIDYLYGCTGANTVYVICCK